jgi:hypothetical protein
LPSSHSFNFSSDTKTFAAAVVSDILADSLAHFRTFGVICALSPTISKLLNKWAEFFSTGRKILENQIKFPLQQKQHQ